MKIDWLVLFSNNTTWFSPFFFFCKDSCNASKSFVFNSDNSVSCCKMSISTIPVVFDDSDGEMSESESFSTQIWGRFEAGIAADCCLIIFSIFLTQTAKENPTHKNSKPGPCFKVQRQKKTSNPIRIRAIPRWKWRRTSKNSEKSSQQRPSLTWKNWSLQRPTEYLRKREDRFGCIY